MADDIETALSRHPVAKVFDGSCRNAEEDCLCCREPGDIEDRGVQQPAPTGSALRGSGGHAHHTVAALLKKKGNRRAHTSRADQNEIHCAPVLGGYRSCPRV
jgi:hypothetical protein